MSNIPPISPSNQPSVSASGINPADTENHKSPLSNLLTSVTAVFRRITGANNNGPSAVGSLRLRVAYIGTLIKLKLQGLASRIKYTISHAFIRNS